MDYLAGVANTDAAAALAALGIPMREEKRLQHTTGDCAEQVTFYFDQRSDCGRFETGEMVRAWDDADWHRDFPRHPLAYLRVFFRNRHRLRDHFSRGVPLAIAWRDGKAHLISLTTPQRPIRTEPFPPPPPGDLVRVDDESLAAALMAAGVPLHARAPWLRTGNGVVYQFHPVSPCGLYHTAALALAWQQEDWWEARRDHPFAYLLCAARNHAFLLEMVRRTAPLVVMTTGRGLPATLPADAPDALQKKFFDRMKKHR